MLRRHTWNGMNSDPRRRMTGLKNIFDAAEDEDGNDDEKDRDNVLGTILHNRCNDTTFTDTSYRLPSIHFPGHCNPLARAHYSLLGEDKREQSLICSAQELWRQIDASATQSDGRAIFLHPQAGELRTPRSPGSGGGGGGAAEGGALDVAQGGGAEPDIRNGLEICGSMTHITSFTSMTSVSSVTNISRISSISSIASMKNGEFSGSQSPLHPAVCLSAAAADQIAVAVLPPTLLSVSIQPRRSRQALHSGSSDKESNVAGEREREQGEADGRGEGCGMEGLGEVDVKRGGGRDGNVSADDADENVQNDEEKSLAKDMLLLRASDKAVLY
jgi:hypothetical protein